MLTYLRHNTRYEQSLYLALLPPKRADGRQDALSRQDRQSVTVAVRRHDLVNACS